MNIMQTEHEHLGCFHSTYFFRISNVCLPNLYAQFHKTSGQSIILQQRDILNG